MEANRNTSLWNRIKARMRWCDNAGSADRFFGRYYKKGTTRDGARKISEVSQKIMDMLPPCYSMDETTQERELREQQQLQYIFRRIRARRRKKIAICCTLAVLGLASLGVLGTYYRHRSTESVYYTCVPRQDSTLLLADRSVVHVKAGSRLGIPRDFSESKRRVRLEGEAYFEVRKHLPARFTVDLGGMQAVVHGTSFNVVNDDGLDVKQVSVSQGKVEVLNRAGRRSLGFLTRGKELTYHPSTQRAETRDTDPDHIAEWREKTFYMENGTLEEFRAKLLRSFGKRLVVSSGALPERIGTHIDVTYTEATPRLVMETFCSIYRLGYAIQGDTIRVWPE